MQRSASLLRTSLARPRVIELAESHATRPLELPLAPPLPPACDVCGTTRNARDACVCASCLVRAHRSLAARALPF